MPLPAIPYELEHYAPHNSILGLWCYAGYVGALAITLLWVGGIYFGMRAYHATKDHDMRATALVSFGSVVIYLCQCWGDMGLGTWNGIWTVAPSIAMAGKLLVQTGEWSTKKSPKKDRREAPRPPPPGQVDPRAA
jgi:O-antigen ligase